MKLSGLLQAFGVLLLVAWLVFLLYVLGAEEVDAVLFIAVSVSALWTTLVLFALAKLLQKISE